MKSLSHPTHGGFQESTDDTEGGKGELFEEKKTTGMVYMYKQNLLVCLNVNIHIPLSIPLTFSLCEHYQILLKYHVISDQSNTPPSAHKCDTTTSC